MDCEGARTRRAADAARHRQYLEVNMNIRLIPGALIIGGLIAFAAPSNLSLAKSNDVGLSASKNMTAKVSSHKHRYWRHRGGKHPHYGSRRIRT